jgi:FdhD protein
MEEQLTKRRQVVQFRLDQRSHGTVDLVQETPLTIFVNERELVTLLCTGHHLEDLVLGFLRSEGLVEAAEDVSSLRLDGETGEARVTLAGGGGLREALFHKRTLGAGCGRASLYYQPLDGLQIRPMAPGFRVSSGQVLARMGEMNRTSPLYRATRGTHNAALSAAHRILVTREDIGRHNAVDMIVGHALRERIPLGDKMLLTTGRASSEIVLKAARLGIPVLVSRSAPTALGAALAQEVGMALVGYVRGGRMTVYSHGERIGKS